jgi:hypothetical protein
VTAIPSIDSSEKVSPSIKYAPADANIGDKSCRSNERLGPIAKYAAKTAESPIPIPTIPLRPIQNHCSLLATGNNSPIKTTCAQTMSPTAIKVRYALTLSGPDFFPANVKKIELIVQQQEARIAADSPTKPEGKYLTLGLKRNYFGFNLFKLSMELMLYAYSD